MAFEGLSEKLNAAFRRLRGKGRITEADVREAMKEVWTPTSATPLSRTLWQRSPSGPWAATCWRV